MTRKKMPASKRVKTGIGIAFIKTVLQYNAGSGGLLF